MKSANHSSHPDTKVHITLRLDTIQRLLRLQALHVSDFSCNSDRTKSLIHEALLKSLQS